MGELLIPWLIESIVEFTCEASLQGDFQRVRAALEFTSALGGLPLSMELRSAPSHSTPRRGRTPADIAGSGRHEKVKRLFQEWPDVEPAYGDIYRFDDVQVGCLGAPVNRRRSSSVRRSFQDAASAVQNAFSTAVG